MSKEKKQEKDVRINLIVSNDLRKRYKLFCLNNDLNMSERIRELIENDLKRNEK